MRFLQAAHMSAGSNTPVIRVVIHCTVSPCVNGGAWRIAQYFASPSSGGSCHYITDPGETVQSVPENRIAWHAPPNPRTIGFELCDPMTGPSSRWFDGPHTAMLQRVAPLVREVCQRHGIPLRKLSVAEVRAGARGICGHADVSKAFGQSTHWDPGPDFPWDHFMNLVGQGGGDTGQPPVITKPTQEDDDMAKILRITPGPDDNPADDSLWLVTADGAAAIGGNEIHSVNRILTAPPGDKVLLVEIEQYRAVCARARA